MSPKTSSESSPSTARRVHVAEDEFRILTVHSARQPDRELVMLQRLVLGELAHEVEARLDGHLWHAEAEDAVVGNEVEGLVGERVRREEVRLRAEGPDAHRVVREGSANLPARVAKLRVLRRALPLEVVEGRELVPARAQLHVVEPVRLAGLGEAMLPEQHEVAAARVDG